MSQATLLTGRLLQGQEANMDLRQLKNFISVVDEGGFGRAASVIGITQQSLSTSIAKLESNLGVRLFERGPAGTSPTVYGKALIHRARLIVLETENAAAELSMLQSADAGEVRLGIGEGLAGKVVPSAVAELHTRSPKLRITLTEGYTEQLLTLLAEGQLDLVAGAPPASSHGVPGIECTRLYTSNDVVLVRAEHPLVRREGKISVADLVDFTWLIGPYRADMYEAICAAFVDNQLPPPTQIIWSDAIATGLALLLSNDYVILVAEDILSPLVDAGLFVILKVDRPSLTRQASLFTRTGALLSPAADLLSRIIIENSSQR